MTSGRNPGTDWIDQTRRLLDVLRSGSGHAADGGAPASDCRWCPVCQAAAVVRGERPDVTDALADVLTATATALRTLAEAGAPAGASAQPQAAEDGESPPPVQRIDIA